MELKNLEKMFEVMASLEPAHSKNSELEEETDGRDTNIKVQNTAWHLKPRKPSLPLAISNPSPRRGSVDTRKSLFHNERHQFNPNINRAPLLKSNSKNTLKPQEITFTEIINEDFLNDNPHPLYHNDSNVYESISILLNDAEDNIETKNKDRDRKSNCNNDTLTTLPLDFPVSRHLVHKDSLEMTKKTKLRYSNLSDNACHNESVDDKECETKRQSAPESARNSVRVTSLYSKDNLSSLDSGVDQQISTNLSSHFSNDTNISNESFSDISESNVTTCSDRDLSSPNEESAEKQDWMGTSSPALARPDLTLKSSEFNKLKYLPRIKTEQEQIQFYRQISKEMSLKNFSPHEIIIFYMADGSSSQVIDKSHTAASVCALLKKKYNKPQDSTWQLTECLGKDCLERTIEDHENILDIFYSWESEHLCNKFWFQENSVMYRIFEQPSAYPNEMKNDFEISDVMWVKAVSGKWIYTTIYISDSNIYYTTKRGSKAPKDLYCLVHLNDVDFYTCSNAKKTKKEIKAQTAHIIVFKTNKLEHKPHENAYLAALTLFQLDKWLVALKVAKYSFSQLKNNYLESQMTFPTGFRSQANSDATLDGTYNPTITIDL